MLANASIIVAALAIGALIGVLTLGEVRTRRSSTGRAVQQESGQQDGQLVPESVVRLLLVLPQSSIIVASSGAVIHSSPGAQANGIVDGNRIAHPSIASMVGEVLRAGGVIEREIQVVRPTVGRVIFDALVRVAPLTSSTFLVLIEDLSESRRIEEVRRDFVANVSHELKTPVGALGLLAEAVEAASDDAEQVRHFAGRMRVESARLAALVADIIDLSRLQGENPLDHSDRVAVDRVIADAVDSTILVASARRIEIVRGGERGLQVLGDEGVLVGAVRNLLSNAVVYSPDETRIAIASRLVDGIVEISVTDQGIGIAAEDQLRIFERFYRVDPARSRGTGGTGLGLAIVKHVCATHGGEVALWSRVGEGSTFTMRIPAYAPENAQSSDGSEAAVSGAMA